MSLRYHFLFWSLAFAGFLAFIFVFKGVLLPFVMGGAVAYLLNPLVTAMGRVHIARMPAALMILGGFFLFVLAFLAVVSPLLYKQSAELIKDMPGYIDQIVLWAEPLSQKFLVLIGQDPEEFDIQAIMQEHRAALFGGASGAAGFVVSGLASGGQAVVDFMTLLVFMPLVAYFLIIEWPNVTKWVEDLLPRDHKNTILDLLSQMNQKISGFVRGQITVALLLGVIYAVVLTLLGLRYGFLIGLVSGLISIIPMVGSIVGFAVGILVAWFQSGDLTFVAMIGGVFLAGQILEGNVISPKLLGDSVGLHPLWVFFALLAGGSLFGILGMFLAVPVAAVAGVLLAFALNLYKGSVYFKGKAKPKPKSKKAVKKKTAKSEA